MGAPPLVSLDHLCHTRLAGFSRPALGEAIAVAVHLEDADMERQAVEQRAGELLGAEGLGPLIEGQIAGDEG